MRVLIVDDDRAVRDALRRALMLSGYDIALAADGIEALDKVAETVPDAENSTRRESAAVITARARSSDTSDDAGTVTAGMVIS